MTGAEKIFDAEFREIMGTPLETCIDAYRVLDVQKRLLQQKDRLIWVSGAIFFLVGSLCVLILLQQREPILMIVPGVGVLLLLLIGLRYSRLIREIKEAQQLLRTGKFDKCKPETVKLSSDLGRYVNEYNGLVGRMNESQSGISWREFRKLTEDQRTYIQATFVRVRVQILSAMRACRQMIDYPDDRLTDLLPRQITFREQELKYEFAAKTMTSEYYLELTESLKSLETSLQKRIQAVATQ